MYLCKNCGGNIVFDIKTQKLVCPFCGQIEDPYEREGDPQEMAKEEEFEVNVFTCPYCGGEIMTQDNELAAFCSFCGTSTTLQGRISKEKRPKFIIPFKKTKEDCKEIYLKKLKSAPYAPTELKDEKAIDSFRGIYMPYWAYNLKQSTEFALLGEKRVKSGNSTKTIHYEIDGSVRGNYNGLPYDSSTSFEDEISESIAPYNTKEMQYFSPSFLSGFYADMEDIPDMVYQPDAIEAVQEETVDRLKKSQEYKKTGKGDVKIVTSDIATNVDESNFAMFPVWFMSYQKGDRVAYSTINGQTGKFSMDIPIDMKKYLLFSLIAALPIFLLLLLTKFGGEFPNTFYSFLLVVFGYITTFVHSSQMFNIINRNNNFSDKGALYKETQNTKVKRKTKGLVLKGVYVAGIVFAAAVVFNEDATTKSIALLVPIIAAVVQCISIVTMLKDKNLANEKFSVLGDGLIVVLTLVIAGLMFGGDFYIIVPLVNMIMSFACAITIINIITRYNVYSTRKLPQFNKTGGNNRA